MKDMRGIVLTGASGGLGTALAAELAAPGRRLLLLGRDRGRLDRTAEAVSARGGSASVERVCNTDGASLERVLRNFDAATPVDLLIANAGVKTGNGVGVEPAGQADRVIDVSLRGTIRAVEALLPGMRARGRGQIAIVGSLAGIAPHGDMLSYSAAKAGLHAYATALRRSLRATHIRVTTVIPGFVATPMTDRQRGRAPMLVSPERAARIIARGLSKRRTTIAFPASLVFASWCAERLPAGLADAIMERYRAEIVPDEDEIRALRK